MTKDEIRDRLVELMKTNACPSPFMCDPTCRYYGYGDCFPDRYADHLITHGVTFADESRWIPVSERLPEKGELVLACGKRHATSGMFQGASPKNPKIWHWKGNTLKDVTHWMPLPEVPKEVVKKNE